MSLSVPATLHHVDKSPTIAELQQLCNGGEKIEIIKTISPNWDTFGENLSLDSDGKTIDDIKEKHKDDHESGCKEMFKLWLSGSGVRPVTWRKLVQVLEDSDYKALASDIRTYLNFK